jgi:tRNA(adenine34) deaminase
MPTTENLSPEEQGLVDERFMRAALDQAKMAAERGEVPVGAVIVAGGQVIGRAHNLCERLHDFTAHAEMQAFTSASEYLGGKHLDQCTLYVTLEPCPMCAGAAFWTRIGRIVYGADDLKRGGGRYKDSKQKGLIHPKTEVISGVLAAECGELMSSFFAAKRK